MKRFYLILPALLGSVAIVFAQEEPYTYGSAPLEQLSMKRYENDTTANAVILYEYGNSVIERDRTGDVKLFYTYKARVKIFKKEAFDKATYKIPLAKSLESRAREKLVYAKAVALNEYEAPVALKEKDVFTENYNERFDVAKFTVPNVVEGTVFDVEYQTVSPFMYNFQEWRFQDDIPKVHSEYHTSIPGNYQYNIKLVGYLKLDSHTGSVKKDCLTSARGGSAGCGLDTYVMKNIPAFVEEKYMTHKENYLSRITFELKEIQDFDGLRHKYTESWKDADKKLKAEDIGKQSRKESSFRKLIPENVSALSDDLDKAKAIYSYLQKRMVWNGKYQIFTDVDVKRAFEERSGSAAELNLVLLNMLNAAGFKAYFMLVSTRDNGVATRLFPVLSEFNYLVVKLDLGEKTYLLDITGKTLAFGMLPFRALNSYGRVMDFDEGSYWYDISAGKLSLNTNYTEYRIDAEGNISANMIDTNSGYLGAFKRSELSEKSQEVYLNAIEDGFGKTSDAEITKYEVAKKDDLDDPVRESFSIDLGKSGTGDLIYIYPFMYNKHEENPFKLKIRTYPVDFGYSFGYNHKFTIKVDPAYEITEIPKPRRYSMGEDSALLVLESYSGNNEVSISLTFMIRKSFFMPDEYRELKDLFGELVNIQNNLPIVLKKKE